MTPDYQPLVAAGADFARFWLWPYLLALLIVVHLVIGRATFVRWMEALGWNGVLAFGANLRDLIRGAPVQQQPGVWTTVPPGAPVLPAVRQPLALDEATGLLVRTPASQDAEKPGDMTPIRKPPK